MEWLKDNLYVIINILAIIASGVSAFILYKLGQWKQPVLDRIAELENSIKIKEAGTAVAAENRADRFGELKEEVAALRRERPNCEKHRMEFDGKLANLKLEIEQKLTTGAMHEAQLNADFREKMILTHAEETKETTKERLSPDGVENTVRRLLDEFRRSELKADLQQIHDRISKLRPS